MHYDVIGDIHGHADQLEVLLQKMGYKRRHGVYSHPNNRMAVFVGDFIDRGPKIRETLHLVKDMCDAGNAMAVMGNHEFNAISFHTPHVERGGFFRDHNLKEIRQHIETLNQFERYPEEWDYFLKWFKTLPLFLELEAFRVVHACWDDEQIGWLRHNYKGINADFLKAANDRNDTTGTYAIVNDVLKGKEIKLSDGLSFQDKDGAVRHEARIKWWRNPQQSRTWNDLVVHAPEELKSRPLHDDTKSLYSYDSSQYVFFGHYWLKGKPSFENSNAICLDYSVAKEGLLVACQVDYVDGDVKLRFRY